MTRMHGHLVESILAGKKGLSADQTSGLPSCIRQRSDEVPTTWWMNEVLSGDGGRGTGGRERILYQLASGWADNLVINEFPKHLVPW